MKFYGKDFRRGSIRAHQANLVLTSRRLVLTKYYRPPTNFFYLIEIRIVAMVYRVPMPWVQCQLPLAISRGPPFEKVRYQRAEIQLNKVCLKTRKIRSCLLHRNSSSILRLNSNSEGLRMLRKNCFG